MPFRLLAVVLLNFLSFSPILALYVVQGSNCTSVCSQRIIPSTTSGSDITCYDRDYNTTAVGALFKDCVACEVQSQTFDHVTEQTDLGWALFINTLKAACIAQPSPATPFPVNPSQIFTLQPPSVYPNSTATSTPAPSSGLSYNAKLAIGITIPLVLLALLSILFLCWYVRIRPCSSKSKSKKSRCKHRGHPSIPSHPKQMSRYSTSTYSQQTPYPEPLRIRYSQPLTHSSGKRLSTIPSTSPPTSLRAPTPSGLTSWERVGIRNSMQTRGSRDLQRANSEKTNPMRSNSQRSNLQRTRSQLNSDTTNLPPSAKGGGKWKMKSQEDLFG